jgi:hypothetical protein
VLANVNGRSVATGRRISQLKQISPSTQCHLPHPNTQTREGYKSKNFKPITLCNVIYKIISKVIALRLKPILPFIISKEQSEYVEGRQIMDSVILVHEVIHSLKSTRTPGILLKLDLSKAFDKLS